MARSRNIKPGFFLNDDLAELPFETRLLFIGLWCHADKAGRLTYRPKKIRAGIFPYESFDVSSMLNALFEKEFIQIYTVERHRYIQITNWDKHQSPHHKEVESILPECNSLNSNNIPSMDQASDKQESSMDQAQGIDKSCETLVDPLIPDSGYLIPDTGLLIPDSGGKPPDDLFKEFWSIYPGPRKRDKPKAKALFNKQSKEIQELIINHIKHRSLNDPEWTKENGKFIPGPVPFLRQNGWTDEYRVNELSQFDEKTQSSIRAGRNFLAEHPE